MAQPLKSSELLALFNKFAGREVPVNETLIRDRGFKGNCSLERSLADENDLTVAEIRQVAKNNNLELDICLDGPRACPREAKPNCVTVNIDRGIDGKWRVSRFDFG